MYHNWGCKTIYRRLFFHFRSYQGSLKCTNVLFLPESYEHVLFLPELDEHVLFLPESDEHVLFLPESDEHVLWEQWVLH